MNGRAWQDWLTTSLALIMGALAGWWLGLFWTFQVLTLLMVLDVASGLVAGRRTTGLTSEAGLSGMRKKALTLIVVGAAALLGPHASLPLGEWAAGAFSLMEFISILENAQRGGVAVPSWIRQAAERVLGQPPAEPHG